MNIALGISCLVAVGVLEGITGIPEQQLSAEDRHHSVNESHVDIQSRKRACRKLGGKCVRRNEDCPNGFHTISERSYCYKRRRCCVPADCPDGTFSLPGSNECFKVIGGQMWDLAWPNCVLQGLVFAQPHDNIAADLREYLLQKYGNQYIWVSGRGDSKEQAWMRTSSPVDVDLLWPGAQNEVEMYRCLSICAIQDCVDRFPDRPYTTYFCNDTRTVLCEVPGR